MSNTIQNPSTTVDYQMAILKALAATGITQFAAGGKARAFADIVADRMGTMEAREFLNLGQTLLPYATGNSLDLIGETFGVSRLTSQVATSSLADQTFRWYVASGTFGDINGGRDIVVPANVQIATSSGFPVFLSDPVTLPAAASAQTFSATCTLPGAGGNVQSGQLNVHNFSGYAQSTFNSLLVTNDQGVVGGRDDESDDNFRSRVRLKLQSPSGMNEAALRRACLEVPGIQDVVFSPASGLITCYVYSVVPQPAPSLLSSVQQLLSNMLYPNYAQAVSPDLIGISLSTTLTLQKNLSVTDQVNIVASARAAVQDYLDNLPIGAPVVVNEIAVRIFNADSRIVDVGQPNDEIPELLIWRSRNDGSRYSRYLLGNYAPATGERIMTETSTLVPNPINLTVAVA